MTKTDILEELKKLPPEDVLSIIEAALRELRDDFAPAKQLLPEDERDIWGHTLDIWGHTLVFIDNHEIFKQDATMARLSRIVVPGYQHHVTQRGVRSMAVFHEESDHREYLGVLGEEIARHGVSVLVW